MLNKKDWQAKEKEFLEMLEKAGAHKKTVEKQLEELQVFLNAVRVEIETFK